MPRLFDSMMRFSIWIGVRPMMCLKAPTFWRIRASVPCREILTSADVVTIRLGQSLRPLARGWGNARIAAEVHLYRARSLPQRPRCRSGGCRTYSRGEGTHPPDGGVRIVDCLIRMSYA